MENRLARSLVLAVLCGSVAWGAYFPDHVVNHQPEWLKATPPKRAMTPIRDFFPRGVYGGSYGEQTWAFQLDDLRTHHMNCWWLNGGGVKDDDLDTLFTMAEQSGVRIIWADNGDPMCYLLRWSRTTPQWRRGRYEKVIAPLIRRRVPRFKDRWGLLAWVVSEEMPPYVVDEVQPHVKLLRQLDTNHPPLLLYNRPEAARRAVELLEPEVITTDVYPLGRDPRCCPDTVAKAMALYRRFCRTYAQIARSAGAALWIMPQAFGSHQAWKPGKPWEGWMGGYYMPNPTFCTWEAWAAIAEGATGIIYYHYYGGHDHRELTMRTEMWNETCQLKAIGDAFAEIEKIAPCLLRAELDHGVVRIASTERDVRVVGFKPKAGPAALRLVVAVNDNIINRRTFQLQHDKGASVRIVDLADGRDVTDESKACNLALVAGTGRLFAIGTAADIAAFRAACTAPAK